VFLEKCAKDWAVICLDERHSEEKLKTIAKENLEVTRNETRMAFLKSILMGMY